MSTVVMKRGGGGGANRVKMPKKPSSITDHKHKWVRAGYRVTRQGKKQRWLCTVCGLTAYRAEEDAHDDEE